MQNMNKQKEKRSCPQGAFQRSFLIFPANFLSVLSLLFFVPVFCLLLSFPLILSFGFPSPYFRLMRLNASSRPPVKALRPPWLVK